MSTTFNRNLPANAVEEVTSMDKRYNYALEASPWLVKTDEPEYTTLKCAGTALDVSPMVRLYSQPIADIYNQYKDANQNTISVKGDSRLGSEKGIRAGIRAQEAWTLESDDGTRKVIPVIMNANVSLPLATPLNNETVGTAYKQMLYNTVESLIKEIDKLLYGVTNPRESINP